MGFNDCGPYGLPPGKQRWDRAADNAEKLPNSQNAQTYRKRLAAAEYIRDTLPAFADQAYAVYGPPQWDWRRNSSASGGRRRAYVMCSPYCAALELQVHYHLDATELVALLSAHLETTLGNAQYSDTFTPERADSLCRLTDADLTRRPHCRVCGVKLGAEPAPKLKALVERPSVFVDPDKHTWLITPNGDMVHPADVASVELSDDVAEVLAEYSTPELRVAYAKVHGKNLV